MNKYKLFKIHLGILIGITIILYALSLKNEFAWDDQSLIVRNDKIHHLSQIPKLFFLDFFDIERLDGPNVGGYYRPLTIASFALDWAFWKNNVVGYHLTNLLLHLLNVLLVFGLIRRLLGNSTVAFWASLLFAIHPLQVDSVAYISGRTDLLAGTFILTTLLLNLLQGKNKSSQRGLQLMGLLAYCGALFSKEIGIIVPPLLFVILFGIKRERLGSIVIQLLPYFLITLGYLYCRQLALHLPPGELITNLQGAHWRFLSILIAISHSMLLFFWPTPIYFERFQVIYTQWTSEMIPGLVYLFLYCALLIFLWKKNRPLFFFGSLYGLALLPVLGIHPLYVQTYLFWTEHFYYLPSIGFFALLVWGIHSFFVNRGQALINKMGRVLGVTGGVLVVVFFSFFTIQRISEWKDEETLFKKAIQHNPNSARAHNNLGLVYEFQNKPQLALKHLQEAAKLCPNSPGAYNNLGNVYKNLGEWEKSMENYDKAIQVGSNTSGVFHNLAEGFIRKNNFAKAEAVYLLAIPKVKDPYALYNHLGMLYILESRESSAMLMFQKALDLKPDFIEALNNVGILLAQKKQFQKAEELFQKAIDWNPYLAETHNNLGNLYLIWERLEEAEAAYRKALQLAPDYADPANGLKIVSQSRP